MLTGTGPYCCNSNTVRFWASCFIHWQLFVFSGLCTQTSAPLHHPKKSHPAELPARGNFGSFIVIDVCIHNPENTNSCERIKHEVHYW